MVEGGFIAESITEPLEGTARTAKVSSSVTISIVAVNVLVFVLLPIVFSSWFPYRQESLGVLWGPLTIHRHEWWRVITYSFVHFQLFHLVPNMLGLWLLGRVMEGELGKWTFLSFYMASAMFVGLTVMALHPFTAIIGASGAITGLAGGTIALYAPRFKSLSWKVRAKLGLLILYAIGLIATELTREGVFLAHTTGLFVGAVLGSFLVHVAKTARSRSWTFGALGMLFLLAALLIQRHNL